MRDVQVIDDPVVAEVSLDPVRAGILSRLVTPSSATQLAAQLGLPRQKVNYHLRTLERHGLVRLREERRKGNMTERVMEATAASYVISPDVLAELQPDPGRAPDRLSASWLLALAAKLVRDIGALVTGTHRAGKRLATFGLDADIRFASAADRAAFTEKLVEAVTELVAEYHDESSEGGRDHRLVVAVHPRAEGRKDG